MNEEEKKAIKDIEEMIELFEDDCLLTTEDDIKYLKVILNLIKKQQKEIEELKYHIHYKICAWCGDEFKTKIHNARYCPKCRETKRREIRISNCKKHYENNKDYFKNYYQNLTDEQKERRRTNNREANRRLRERKKMQMNEEEKKAIELLKKDCLVTSQQIKDGELFMIEDEEKMRISATQVLLNLIEKQQKEIEDLKAITRTYEAYKFGEGNKIMIASKEWFNDGYFKENFISKDKIKEIIKNHKKFLSNEFSKYSEDDIENRKAIQYASARLSFLLADIYKLGNKKGE